MSRSLRPALIPLSALLGAGALTLLATSSTGDYVPGGRIAGDNPAPAIDALSQLHLARAGHVQPLMGLVSLLLRAPAAALAHALNAGPLTSYRLGAAVCLLAAVALGIALVAGTRTARERTAATLAAVLLLAVPATREAVGTGHPEEILAAALCVLAVLAASADRDLAAAVLLALAIATKQWAIIAGVPVLAASAAPARTAATAAVVAAPLLLALPLADPRAFDSAAHTVGGTHFVNALSAWWPLGGALTAHVPGGAAPVRLLPLGLTRSSASLVPAIAAIAVAASALLRGERATRTRALALLAALAVVRCLADPLPLHYYFVPVVFALAAWEVAGLRRVPAVTGTVVVALALTFGPGLHLPDGLLNALTLTAAGALLAVLTRPANVTPGHRRHRALGWAP